VEKKGADALEMAAQANAKGKTEEKTEKSCRCLIIL